jgi:DNA-binding MarR family transcriptional regulator
MSSPHSKELPRAGVAFLLSQVGAHVAATFAARLKPLKITPGHAGILRAIGSQRGISQRSLATLLGMHASRLVLVLDEMEKLGLVERKASENDRRTYALHLTARGKEKLETIGQVARDLPKKVCAALKESERETLAELLAKIAAEQGLTPGVHPGYRQVSRGDSEAC